MVATTHGLIALTCQFAPTALRWAILTALLAPWASHAQAPGMPAMSVQPSWGNQSVPQGESISLNFSQTLEQLGPIVVLLGREDVTAQFSPAGPKRLQASFAQAPMPIGDHTLQVMRVTSPTDWEPLVAVPITVVARKSTWQVSGNVGIKGQAWVDPDGVALPPVRPTYADATTQLGLVGEQGDDALGLKAKWQLAGSSYRNEAVQFPVRRQEAPKPDVLTYSLLGQANTPIGRTEIGLGQVSAAANPLLAPAIGNRGLSLTQRVSNVIDVALGVQAGGQLLGARNLTGTEDDESRFATARIGVEVLPERPGALRIELGWFDGQQAPSTLYNIVPGVIEHQRSHGWGWHISGNTEDARWQWDLSTALSRYESSDPGLASDSGLKRAYAGNVSYDILPMTTWGDVDVALSASLKQDYAQALYRSLAGGPIGDYQSRVLSLNGQLGIIALGLNLEGTEDNVHDDAQLPKNLGSTISLNAVLPTARLPLISGLMGPSAAGNAAWPQLSYNYVRNHAWGDQDFVPLDMLIDDLPDTLMTEHQWGLKWTLQTWSIGYRYTTSFQDTLQADLAEQDMRMRGHQVDLQWRPLPTVTLGVMLGLNRSRMMDTGWTNRGQNLALDGRWRVWPDLQLTGNLTRGQSILPNGPTTNTFDTLQLGLQGKARVPSVGTQPWTGHWFARWAASHNAARSDASGLKASADLRALQTGLSIAF
jgi:hypothetical protein